MLLAIPPLAFVNSAITIIVSAVSMSLIVFELALVESSVSICQNPSAMHIILDPFTNVALIPVTPLVFSCAMPHIVNPFTLVNIIVWPFVDTLSVFNSIPELSLEFGSITPFFFALAILKIILELAFIIVAILTGVESYSIGHIVFEFTFINISLAMSESSLAISHIIDPLPFIKATIRPVLDTISLPHDIGLLHRIPRAHQLVILILLIRYFIVKRITYLFHLASENRIVFIPVLLHIHDVWLVHKINLEFLLGFHCIFWP